MKILFIIFLFLISTSCENIIKTKNIKNDKKNTNVLINVSNQQNIKFKK